MSFDRVVHLGRIAVQADNAAQTAIQEFRKAWDELKVDSAHPEKLKEEVWAEMTAEL